MPTVNERLENTSLRAATKSITALRRKFGNEDIAKLDRRSICQLLEDTTENGASSRSKTQFATQMSRVLEQIDNTRFNLNTFNYNNGTYEYFDSTEKKYIALRQHPDEEIVPEQQQNQQGASGMSPRTTEAVFPTNSPDFGAPEPLGAINRIPIPPQFSRARPEGREGDPPPADALDARDSNIWPGIGQYGILPYRYPPAEAEPIQYHQTGAPPGSPSRYGYQILPGSAWYRETDIPPGSGYHITSPKKNSAQAPGSNPRTLGPPGAPYPTRASSNDPARDDMPPPPRPPQR